MTWIPFNKPCFTGSESEHVLAAMRSSKMSGDGEYSRRCEHWLNDTLGSKKTFLTSSCTHALEMTAILLDVRAGDEVIMPSYTFTSTANAFAIRGATIVFVDIREDTMNMNERLIEAAITEKTKAIVPVHYAGVACEMSTIMSLAHKYNLCVIEDAAQGLLAYYKGKALGTLGHMGTFSFHETKNYTSGGEGGALLVNDPQYIERAEIIREKGTNRSQFFRGLVDKYTWVDIGSSYLPCELQAAYLWGQFENGEKIKSNRVGTWNTYKTGLQPLADKGLLDLPFVPDECDHNGHMFYIKAGDLVERTALIKHLTESGVNAIFHYVPLHSAPAGKKNGRFYGADNYSTRESERIVRLPFYYGITQEEIAHVVNTVWKFFN